MIELVGIGAVQGPPGGARGAVTTQL